MKKIILAFLLILTLNSVFASAKKNFSAEELLNLAKGSIGVLASEEGRFSAEMVKESEKALITYYKTDGERKILSEAYRIVSKVAENDKSKEISVEKLVQVRSQFGIK